ncbi:MAG TPA: hypothetical protein VGF59_21510 [Bryobacteraceae bacterium]|jgi:hypothetical protein
MFAAGASVGSASSITYWVDVFSGITTAQACVGTCPDHNSATLGTGGGPNITLTVPKFDQTDPNPNHHFELTDVAITLDWKATGTVTVFNFFSSAVPFDNAQASTLMTLTADATQVVANGAAGTGPGVAACCNILNNNPPGFFLGQTTFGGLTGNGANTQNSGNLGFFEGFGVNSFAASLATDAVAVTGTSSDTHSSSLAYQGSGQMGAIATFTYTYTEVAGSPAPEPVTFSLAGVALIGLGLVRRSRKA